MKRKLFTLLLIMVACASVSLAQSRSALRINEIMVQNVDNAVDDYGCRTAWIELFNSNFAPLNISNIYITNNPEVLNEKNPLVRKTMMYPVPLGDVNTKIEKRQHVIFWADSLPTRGTFHLNFKLTPGKENWIGVFDANALDLIDSVTVPATLQPNTSYARAIDGVTNAEKPELTWQVRDNLTDSTYVTPSSNNVIKDKNDKVEMFATKDPNGFAMTILAMSIVFSALLVLCLSFYVISKIGAYISKRNKAKTQGASLKDLTLDQLPTQDSGEEIAAIVMALHEHLNAHDSESTILTIDKVKRVYSPWSSKIYGLREVPRR